MEAILGHQNLDFDCVSSMVAAQKIHPDSNIFLQPTSEGNVLEYLNLYRHHFSFQRHSQFDLDVLETVIVVDTNRRSRLGPYEEAIDAADRIVVYDHHPPEQSNIDADEYYFDSVGALITYMVELLRGRSLQISPIEATLFLLGLHQETGSLQFGNTDARDYETGKFLMEAGANLDVVQNFIHRQLNEDQIDLFNDLLDESRQKTINNVPVTIATAEREEYLGEISLLTHKLQETENCNVLFVLVRLGNRIQMVFRSRYEYVDVGSIAEEFGGGGHGRAASATLSGITLHEAESALEDTLRDRLKPELVAEDIMSKPVHSVRQDLPVSEAQNVMHRLGHQGMPIIDENEELVGIISRTDIDKAIQHDLTHAPVKGFMSPHVVTASQDTSLSQLKEIMMDEQIGRLPIVEGGEIRGIVSRSDMIRALHRKKPLEGETNPAVHQSYSRDIDDNIEPRIPRLLPKPWTHRLKEWGKLAAEMDEQLFIVGGCVRDLLMEKPIKDIDFVVERDGIQFARELVNREGGRCSVHEKFRTAVITLPDDTQIDIATARSEYYSHPAALPDVEIDHVSVAQDLRRRDFTINAMAVSVNPETFGDLLDPYGGRTDIVERQIRILYATSFLDDPTRIFRAVRFAERFHFEIEDRTYLQMKQALRGHPFDPVSGDRIREELNLIFQESEVSNIVQSLYEYEIMQELSPEFSKPGDMSDYFRNAGEYLEQYEVKHPELVYYLILFEPLSDNTAVELAQRLNFPSSYHKQIKKSTDFKSVREQLAEVRSPSEIVRALEDFDYTELLIARCCLEREPIRNSIRKFLNRLAHVEPIVTGDELEEWGLEPGPEMGEILDRLYYYQLDHPEARLETLESFYREQLEPELQS